MRDRKLWTKSISLASAYHVKFPRNQRLEFEILRFLGLNQTFLFYYKSVQIHDKLLFQLTGYSLAKNGVLFYSAYTFNFTIPTLRIFRFYTIHNVINKHEANKYSLDLIPRICAIEVSSAIITSIEFSDFATGNTIRHLNGTSPEYNGHSYRKQILSCLLWRTVGARNSTRIGKRDTRHELRENKWREIICTYVKWKLGNSINIPYGVYIK